MVPLNDWKIKLNLSLLEDIVTSLESGQVLFFPNLAFPIFPEEKVLFSPTLVKKNRKNISYNSKVDQLKACEGNSQTKAIIQSMMKRFSDHADQLLLHLFPGYELHLDKGLTSFRTVEAKDKPKTSLTKNDSLLHLDSFHSSPTGGRRILRFFTNVNPFNKPRVWKVGESYQSVLKRFLPTLNKPLPGSRLFMNRFGITKSYRSLYDHFMLGIHNKMKADDRYQREVDQETIEFPPNSCWMCFTDQVSHAALSGQYAFEQSYFLSLEGLIFPEKSPLHYMESILKKRVRN
ncbi:MAG: hypothetical protein S4CHLAM7_04750 [Chlamydiae bacterium]|nr:hypothetical protein [Chlamydiota bacterium]